MLKLRSFQALLVVALLALALAACKAAPGVEQQAVSTPAPQGPARTLTVVGVGKISLKPDVAELNLGIEVLGSTVSEAKAEVDRQIASILAALKGAGVEDKDIQTSSYNIYYDQGAVPRSAEGAEPASQGGYRVSNILNVTLRNVEQVGSVLDAAVAAGVNQVYGVQFTVADNRQWESQARQKAMADAKSRAEELAGLSGVQLGQVVSVSEVIGSVPFAAMAERGYGGGGGGIVPGELEFTMQVQVTYAIQ